MSRLQFYLSIVLLLFVMGGISCMKRPELTADFGPEVSDQSFEQALGQIETPSPYTIQPNEYSYATRETWVEGRPYLVNPRWAFTVTAKTEETDDYVISFVHELRETQPDGTEKVSSTKADGRLAKQQGTASPETVAPTANSPNEQTLRESLAHPNPIGGKNFRVNMNPYSVFSHTIHVLEDVPRVTRHNLKFSKGTFPIPDFTTQRSDCGGLGADKCKGQLTAYYMSFDQVNWDENGGQKYSLLRVFSPDVPFFASTMAPDFPGVIQACVSTTLSEQGQPVDITQCDEIKDFTFGHP